MTHFYAKGLKDCVCSFILTKRFRVKDLKEYSIYLEVSILVKNLL